MTISLDAPSIAAPPPRSAWGGLASLCLHGALMGLLLMGPNKARLEPHIPRSIAVEMISASQFAALQAPAEPPSVPVAPKTAPPSGAATAAESEAAAPKPKAATNGAMTQATTLYSGALLAEPASAKLRAAMPTLDGRERAVQLCDIEAMEQIRRSRPEFDPDMVVAYAMADMLVRDGALVADGAAFRSRREWYEVRFSCTVAADFSGVATFSFTVGSFIPHELWDAHYLTAEESDE